ncbi:MAG: ABC transporter permease [Chloroflexota bacterium]
MVQLAGRIGRWLFLALIVLYFAVPMIAVLFYSFSGKWTANVLPDIWTTKHWGEAFADERMRAAFIRTVLMAFAVLILDVLIVVPAVYWQRVRNPRIRILAELSAAIPFVLPFIIIAFGILKLTGRIAPELLGTPWIILFGHAAIAFPFLYWAIDGSMSAAGIVRLNEAAVMSGASPLQTLRHVVIPNITPGLAAGGMLVFATSFGEFALVQILAGARFENVSLYSLDLLNNTTSQVEKLAVLTIVMFLVLFAISIGVVYVNRNRVSLAVPGGRAMAAEKDL